MPFSREVLAPEEIALLGRVFDRTSVPNETEADREHRASKIIYHYQTGITDEAELDKLARKSVVARTPASLPNSTPSAAVSAEPCKPSKAH